MSLYQNSLLTKLHTNEDGTPISVGLTEIFVVRERGLIQLSEFPDAFQRPQIQCEGKTLIEVQGNVALSENQFKVNYSNGFVFFHPSMIGKTIKCSYYGRGVELISTNRIFHSNDDDEVVEVLHDIVERGKATTDSLEKLNEELNQAEANRQTQFENAFEILDEKILSEENEFDQLRNQQALDHQQQLEDLQQSFDEKVEMWDDLVLKLGVINDNETLPTQTWSSEKIQTELDTFKTNSESFTTEAFEKILNEESSITPASTKLAKFDENGYLNANKLNLTNNRGLSAKEDGVYVHNGSVETKVITEEMVSINSSKETIVKRDSGSGINALRYNVYDSTGTIRGQFLADAQNRAVWVKGSSSSTSDREVIWTTSNLPRAERGSWTPKPRVEHKNYLTGVDAVGHYYAIGSTVVLTGRFKYTGLPSDTAGRLIIEGLPFACKGNATTGNVGVSDGMKYPSGVGSVICEIPSGQSEIRFYWTKADGSGVSNYSCANLLSEGEIHFSFVYLID